MLKIGGIIAMALVAGFVFFPTFRGTLVALAPVTLLLLCPLGMMVGMAGMKKMSGNGSDQSSSPETKKAAFTEKQPP